MYFIYYIFIFLVATLAEYISVFRLDRNGSRVAIFGTTIAHPVDLGPNWAPLACNPGGAGFILAFSAIIISVTSFPVVAFGFQIKVLLPILHL